ncbi:baseplate wedge subunit [Synechococcus phage S-CREM1]|nr:baseplate wedge subunit [Synechococcus phage S-CREM1]
MANYFSNVPNIRVGVPGMETSQQEYVTIKNIFRRVKGVFLSMKRDTIFEKYTIPGDEKPYQVSQRIYKTPDYEWIILLTNDITNIYSEWPLSQREFEDMMQRKYGTRSNETKHWVTKEVIFENMVIVQPGIIVNQNYTYKRPDGVIIGGDSLVRPISHYEYEYELNENKRLIYLLNPVYIDEFDRQMRELLQYPESEDRLSYTEKKSGDDDEIYAVRIFEQ